MYSRLPPEPQRKEPDIDLFPDTHEEDAKAGLSSYLDEFLSAIKIFGYLERSVFHELTRSMQTRKLIAGETLDLEEEKGFCLVVDGLVEIFVKSSRDTRNPASATSAGLGLDSSLDSDEEIFPPGHGGQQYQLLTEVRNGAPMSSLFSIMSLFTEDVQLRHTDYDGSDQALVRTAKPMHTRNAASVDFRKQRGMPVSYPNTPQMGSESESPEADMIEANGGIPHMSLDPPSGARLPPQRPIPKRMGTSSAHPDIIARATVDTTIAIIPASAFRRLIKIYPKATAHIVHVILSRFQRVTLATAFSYLGLTGEVLQTEKNMVKYTMCQLPNHLRGDALERLKEKFQRERDRIGEGDVGKGIALHNPRTGQRRRSSTALRKEAALQALNKQRPSIPVASTMASPQVRGSTDTPSPGDLLTNVNMRPTGDARSTTYLGISPTDQIGMESVSPLAQRTFNPFATQRNLVSNVEKREAVDEDNLFRESILDCMFKSIGLTSTSTGSNIREPDSSQASPRLFSYDQRRHRSGFGSNAFGFMDSFEGSGDGDTESMASGMSMQPGVNINLLAHDMKDEVDIVFFPKGSVLVEQGERNPGLYYVIDGFLDICTTVEDRSPDILHSSRKDSSDDSIYEGSASSKPRAPSTSRFSVPEMGGGPADGKKKKKMRRQSVALIKPGGLAGYVGTISSYRSFIDVVAKTDVYVGFLPRASIERIVDRNPIVLLTMAKRLTNLLPRLILHIDFALEWLQVNAGQVLFHGGEESEAIYIVLNGRLRLVEDKPDGGVSARAEFGQGESVGELEVLTESVRSGTLHAIRDTELVKFPRTLFNSLAQEHPNITIKISKIIASRTRNLVNTPAVSLSNQGGVRTSANKGLSTLNLRTVAVLPVTAGVPVVEFGNRLMSALSQVGPPNGATSLNQSAILNHLGRHAFNKMGKLKLAQYLADLEEKYGLVIYVAGKLLYPLPQ